MYAIDAKMPARRQVFWRYVVMEKMIKMIRGYQMNKYHTILWDVDGTLLDFKKSQEHALHAAFGQFGLVLTPQMLVRYDEINDGFWKRLERGEVDKQTLLTGRFLQLFAEFAIQGVAVNMLQETYQKELGSVYFYLDDSYALCQSLSGRFRQFIVTNGVAATQRGKLRLAGFDAIMEELFISEEIGSVKPERQFFDACFAKIKGFAREGTLIVGDSLTSDMKGGANAGIDTCWYNPNGVKNDTDTAITYEIRHLWDIKKILGER